MDYGEADRILVIMTAEYGRVDAIAKGARKVTSKLGAKVDVLMRVQLDMARGRELDVIRAAIPVGHRVRLRTDLQAFGVACYIADVVRTLMVAKEPQPDVYALLAGSLALLEDGVDGWLVARHFELALMALLGFAPRLFECARCGRTLLAEPNGWSPLLGGMVCRDCAQHDPAATVMSVNAQKIMRILARDGLAAASKLTPSDAERYEVQHAMAGYVRSVSERDLSSVSVLAQLDSSG